MQVAKQSKSRFSYILAATNIGRHSLHLCKKYRKKMESGSTNKRAQAEWEIASAASRITMHQSKVGKDGTESWHPHILIPGSTCCPSLYRACLLLSGASLSAFSRESGCIRTIASLYLRLPVCAAEPLFYTNVFK